MITQAETAFEIKSWDEKSIRETEGAPKPTRVSVTMYYSGIIDG